MGAKVARRNQRRLGRGSRATVAPSSLRRSSLGTGCCQADGEIQRQPSLFGGEGTQGKVEAGASEKPGKDKSGFDMGLVDMQTLRASMRLGPENIR